MFDLPPDAIAAVVLTLSIVAMMGMAHVTVRTKDKNGESQAFDLEVGDDAPQDQVQQIERYAETREERARADLQADLDATEEELSAMTDLVVSEIIRRQKLAGQIGEDAELSVEDQREYLEGLPAERLQMEWERAPSEEDLSGSTEMVTTGDDPDETSADYEQAVSDLAA